MGDKMIKLISIDLDGTLLNDKKEVNPKDIDYLKHLIDKGIKVAVTTGRDFFSAKSFFPDDLKLTFVTLSGNAIFDYKGNEIYANYFDYETILKLANFSDDNFLTHVNGYKSKYNVLMLNGNYSTEVKKYIERFYFPVKFVDKFEKNEKYFSCVFVGDVNYLYNLSKEIEKVENNLNFYLMPTNLPEYYMLEIVQGGISKFTALKRLMEKFNINIEEVMAFGDEENDMEMLSKVKYGYIMKNARKTLKNNLKETDFTNNEGGVVKTIKEWDLI